MNMVNRRSTFVKPASRLPIVALAIVAGLLVAALIGAFSGTASATASLSAPHPAPTKVANDAPVTLPSPVVRAQTATTAAIPAPKVVAVDPVTSDLPARVFVTEPAPMTFTIRLAVVGDSTSAWNGTSVIPHPWTTDLADGPVQVDYTAGWAVGGAHLDQMAAGMTPTTDDVLVVMGGLNDLGPATGGVTSVYGEPIPWMIANVEAIVAKSGLPANRVVLSSVGPWDAASAWSPLWNAAEQSLAASKGWGYVDPWAGIRTPQNTYIPAYTIDGTHPTDAGSLIVAQSIASYVESMKLG